ncbi:perforin-1-like [Gymnodraco acuticeps]|uniref:Perforin-1-like n=1 Tax=Gymnodraco acuticeps TaxID=8218 RepID=A0A6P8TDX5_GYMAC|nr:perforin-1-like [Gymnodraco acuticeps]
MASCSPLLLLLLCALTVAEAQLKVFDLRASNLDSGFLGSPDGYVKIFYGSATLGETSVRDNNQNPWWKEEFTHVNAREYGVMRLEVYDEDIGSDELLGVCRRIIRLGTHEHACVLEEGGTLHYTYSFVELSQ